MGRAYLGQGQTTYLMLVSEDYNEAKNVLLLRDIAGITVIVQCITHVFFVMLV